VDAQQAIVAQRAHPSEQLLAAELTVTVNADPHLGWQHGQRLAQHGLLVGQTALPTMGQGTPGQWERAPAKANAHHQNVMRIVQQDAIHCLVCGGVFRQLTNTHLRSHGLTADEYKHRFGYNRGRPLMCRALRRLYADRAVRNGLAARIRQRPILARPELRRRGGARTIALEELLTRREVRRGFREPHTAP